MAGHRVSDVWDEEYQTALAESDGDLSYAQFAENHRFQVPAGAHWNDMRQTPKNVGAAIAKAMRAIESANGGEHRTLKLYGQERNLITSSIARMNLFLHGVVDFEIIRGDTLAEPKHIEGDRLRQFDVILANPPYSIKQWNREAWGSDTWGRHFLGTPPQGRADYALQQHILASLTPDPSPGGRGEEKRRSLRRAVAAWRTVP